MCVCVCVSMQMYETGLKDAIKAGLEEGKTLRTQYLTNTITDQTRAQYGLLNTDNTDTGAQPGDFISPDDPYSTQGSAMQQGGVGGSPRAPMGLGAEPTAAAVGPDMLSVVHAPAPPQGVRARSPNGLLPQVPVSWPTLQLAPQPAQEPYAAAGPRSRYQASQLQLQRSRRSRASQRQPRQPRPRQAL